MVQWTDAWLEKVDKNQVKVKLWAAKKDSNYAHCKLCSKQFKFSTQGFQAFEQHSITEKHKGVSDIRFANSVCHLVAKPSCSNSASSVMVLDPALNDKVSAAEAKWLFNVAEKDLSFRDCDSTPAMFQDMFSDSVIAKSFTMSSTKASYCMQDGLGPLLCSMLCEHLRESNGAFTLMFDETTTLQNRKQMDILVRYWDEGHHKILTKYLGSMFFGRATAVDITAMLMEWHDKKLYDLPWDRLFNISSDGPNINRAIWRELDGELKKRGYKGLVEFINCTLHTVHTGFRKGITSNNFGEMAEQLAFDLHAWFKKSPCKKEDFKEMAESLEFEDEALFYRFVNTRWLTLSPALEKVVKRWSDCKKYFLEHIPKQKEYKKTLTQNQRYARIKKCLTDSEKDVIISMKFLIGIAPVFESYLRFFQDEGPLAYCLFNKIKELLTTVMKRFIKPSVVDELKLAKDLKAFDVEDTSNHQNLGSMDFGAEVKSYIQVINNDQVKEQYYVKMRDAYIAIVKYLKSNLPLDSNLLKSAACLGPTVRSKEWTVSAIGNLASMMLHVVGERELSLVKDQWKLYQTEEIPDEWFIDPNTAKLKRIDLYWHKVFEIKDAKGEKKYDLLEKVVKSCLSLQHGNASVERSLSDNKNTLTAERTNLSDEAIAGLRRAKEHARECRGAHNVQTLNKPIIKAVREAHKKHEERKAREKEEIVMLQRANKEKVEAERKQKLLLAEAEKKKERLDKKEEELKKDEENLNTQYQVAQRMLEDAEKQMDLAIANKDMVGVRVARQMISAAKENLVKAAEHRTQQSKLRGQIGTKRKSAFEKLMKSVKNKQSKR